MIDNYWKIIIEKENEIKTGIRSYIKSITKSPISPERIEELYSELIATTAEKYISGSISMTKPNEIISYLVRGCYNRFLSQEKKKLREEKFNINYQHYLSTSPGTEAVAEEAQRTGNLYDEIFKFLDTLKPIEAGLFKCYYINGYTYDTLTEKTGYPRGKCWNVVNKVEKKLFKHLKSRGYNL